MAHGQTTSTPQPGDPAWFDGDTPRETPAERARDRARHSLEIAAIIAVQESASAGASSWIDGFTRTISALTELVDSTGDDLLAATADDQRSIVYSELAEASALDGMDIARKLSALVTRTLRASDRPDWENLMLAASALADAVALASGPIRVPPLPAGLTSAADIDRPAQPDAHGSGCSMRRDNN
jgi:hypothetical protein